MFAFKICPVQRNHVQSPAASNCQAKLTNNILFNTLFSLATQRPIWRIFHKSMEIMSPPFRFQEEQSLASRANNAKETKSHYTVQSLFMAAFFIVHIISGQKKILWCIVYVLRGFQWLIRAVAGGYAVQQVVLKSRDTWTLILDVWLWNRTIAAFWTTAYLRKRSPSAKETIC